MKKIRKSLVAVILTVTVVTGTVSGGYHTAHAASIAAGYTAFEILQGIFLSLGFTAFTAEMIKTITEDPAAKEQEWREIQLAHLEEMLEAEYERARKKNSGPSPTPSPGIIATPTYQDVKEKMKENGKIVFDASIGVGVWECMREAVKNLWDSLFGRISPDPLLSQDCLNIINENQANGYVYYRYSTYGSSHILYLCGPGSFIFGSRGDDFSFTKFVEYNKNRNDSSFVLHSTGNSSYGSSAYDKLNTNLPYFSTYQEGLAWSKSALNNPIKKEDIWVNPDLESAYQNNTGLDLPQEAPQPLTVPTFEQLQSLAQQLKDDPDQSPNYVQQLIDQLKDPTVNPTPNPVPTGSPDPQPTGSPDPQPTGSPDPSPDEELNPYKTDLTKVFPFCIPFDLIHLLRVFDAEPQAPVFEFPLDLELDNPFTGKKVIDYHHIFKVDMKDYEPVVKILRIFQVIFFVIALMMITRQQMIKG